MKATSVSEAFSRERVFRKQDERMDLDLLVVLIAQRAGGRTTTSRPPTFASLTVTGTRVAVSSV